LVQPSAQDFAAFLPVQVAEQAAFFAPLQQEPSVPQHLPDFAWEPSFFAPLQQEPSVPQHLPDFAWECSFFAPAQQEPSVPQHLPDFAWECSFFAPLQQEPSVPQHLPDFAWEPSFLECEPPAKPGIARPIRIARMNAVLVMGVPSLSCLSCLCAVSARGCEW